MADLDLTSYNELREKYIESIAQNLGEARFLMIKLNSNLQLWAEKTGDLNNLATVWAAFQNRLASLSAAFGGLEEEKQLRETVAPESPLSLTGNEDD